MLKVLEITLDPPGHEWVERSRQPGKRNKVRVAERDIDVMLGICQGVMADGVVTLEEAQFLQSWIQGNQHVTDQWPGDILWKRLQLILADGVLSADEERELLALLVDIAGIKTVDGDNTTTSLPYCDPMPEITHQDKTFCITGTFASGERKEVEGEIIHRGGATSRAITTKVDYLIIGEFASKDWAHKSFGRKIEKAIDYREKGHGVSLVSERHWIESLAK